MVSYAGSQSGAAYIRVTSDDGGRAYSFCQTALLRFGQTTIIRIDVVDPP